MVVYVRNPIFIDMYYNKKIS